MMKDKAQELERAVQSNHPIKQLASLLIFKLFFHHRLLINSKDKALMLERALDQTN